MLGKENEDGAAFELDLTSLRQVLHLFQGVGGTTLRVRRVVWGWVKKCGFKGLSPKLLKDVNDMAYHQRCPLQS